jgi:hypothetical protein
MVRNQYIDARNRAKWPFRAPANVTVPGIPTKLSPPESAAGPVPLVAQAHS